MKIKTEQLLDYVSAATNWLRQKPDNARTKLGYCIQKMGRKIEKALRPYQDIIDKRNIAVEKINIKYAATDSEGVIQKDFITQNQNGQPTQVEQYRFKKDVMDKRNDEIRQEYEKYNDLLDEAQNGETEIEPFYCKDLAVIRTLSEWEKETFKGIVIDPEDLKAPSSILMTEKNPLEVVE